MSINSSANRLIFIEKECSNLLQLNSLVALRSAVVRLFGSARLFLDQSRCEWGGKESMKNESKIKLNAHSIADYATHGPAEYSQSNEICGHCLSMLHVAAYWFSLKYSSGHWVNVRSSGVYFYLLIDFSYVAQKVSAILS